MFHKYAEDTFKRRDRLYTIADVLEASRTGTIKTEIMHRAGLSFAQLKWFLSLLVKLGLVEDAARKGRLIYKTTSKGIQHLKCCEEIRSSIETS